MNDRAKHILKLPTDDRQLISKFSESMSRVLAILLIAFVASCSGSKKVSLAPPPPTKAVGVDPGVLAEADSIADHLFVSWDRQQLAAEKRLAGEKRIEMSNELWDALEGVGDETSAETDTVAAVETFNKGARHLLALQKLQDGSIDEETVRRQSLAHLDSARFHFERALQLNPFDRNTRLWLARVYQMSAERLVDDQHYGIAARFLENLIRMDKGQHGLYGRLGQIYMAMQLWTKALDKFSAAETVLSETAVFDVPDETALNDSSIAAATDSASLFLYVYYQAENHIRLYDTDEALANLTRSEEFARNEEDLATIKSTRDWIGWDDGNIRGAEFRDELLDMVDEERYKDAAKGFDALSKKLTTNRARREIQWRLAILEFTHLEKEEQAMKRMVDIADFYNTDTTGIAQTDTMFSQYFDSYGTMCHNMGLASLKLKKLRKALAYFKQATIVPWKQQAKSHVEIAKLSINNPALAVSSAEKALNLRNQLNGREQEEALRMMVEGLKRLGRFQEATRYYREYRDLVSIGKKSS